MSLVKCPDCEKLVSSRVETCPFCGCPAEFFEEASADEVAEMKGKETASKEAAEKKQVKRHVFSIEMVGDVYALFMIDDDGNEIRISENKDSLSVIDYCETDKYVYYVVTPKAKPDKFGGGFSYYPKSIVLCRYEKSTGEKTKLVDKFPGSSNRVFRCYENNKEIRSENRERIIFAGGDRLFSADYTGFHRMDFDGKNDRVFLDRDQTRVKEIIWIYDDIIWCTHDAGYGDTGISMYSLHERKLERITDSYEGVCTDGNVVFVCTRNSIVKLSMNGKEREEIATYSKDSSIVEIQDMNIVDGNLVLRVGDGVSINEQYEIHKGDRFMFK